MPSTKTWGTAPAGFWLSGEKQLPFLLESIINLTQSVLEQNHFSQMTACHGDDSSPSEAGITEVASLGPWSKWREMGHLSLSQPELSAHSEGGPGATDREVCRLHHFPQKDFPRSSGGSERAIMAGRFCLDSSHCCNQALQVSGSFGWELHFPLPVKGWEGLWPSESHRGSKSSPTGW